MTTAPAGRDPRVVYFISSYRSPEQLCRLISTLRHDRFEAPIVIHHDVFQSPLDASLFASMTDVHVLTSDYPILWGDFSLEAVRWRAFRWIAKNIDFDWVMLLSEQDYPLAPLRDLRHRLATSDAEAIISGEVIENIDDRQVRREVIARYTFQYRSLPNLKIEQRFPKAIQRLSMTMRRLFFAVINHTFPKVFIHTTPGELHTPSKIGIRSKKNPFNTAFPCWFHDSWFALSRKAVEHVIDYIDAHPNYVEYFTHTMIPVEAATGTIVFNDPDLKVVNTNLTATIWSRPKLGRPDTIGMDNLQFLYRTGAAFARKFAGENTEVLDELDKRIFQAQPDVH
jgi:hypothetical protein